MYIGTNENGQISGKKKNPVYVNILERETEKWKHLKFIVSTFTKMHVFYIKMFNIAFSTSNYIATKILKILKL